MARRNEPRPRQVQDAHEIVSKLRKESVETAILKAHQHIEADIDAILAAGFKFPKYVPQRLKFSEKVDLACALGLLTLGLRPPLARLDSLRNQSAHDRDFEFSKKDALEFENLLTSANGDDKAERKELIKLLRDIGYELSPKVFLTMLWVFVRQDRFSAEKVPKGDGGLELIKAGLFVLANGDETKAQEIGRKFITRLLEVLSQPSSTVKDSE